MKKTALLTFSLILTLVPFPVLGGEKGMQVIPASAARYAVLVGVNDYEKCDDLRYCKADVTALAEQLAEIGFDRRDIVVLTDDTKLRPSRRNILEQLDATLKVADGGDLVVVALSGHGAMIGGKSYFCPADARPDDPEGTLIRIDELYEKLEECPARLKMVFIDACRNKFLPVDSRPLSDQAKSIDGFAKSLFDGDLPKGMVLLASCTSGERSWEDKDFGHGVFMHFVMEGLSGKADAVGGDGKKDQWVSLFELCDYVQSQTKRHVLRTRRVAQRPYYHTSIDLPDFRLTPVPDAGPRVYTEWPFDETEARRRQEETAKAIGRPVEFTNSIGIKFRLIPAGEFMMGSPEGDDDEKLHRVRITKPFYLGIHEVTVGDFRRFVSDTGYKTEAEKDGMGGFGYDVKDGSSSRKPEYTWRNPGFSQSDDHPVVEVSWNDAVAFGKWLSKKEGRTYRLPTEAEWEYACRAGTTTNFYCGDDVEGLALVGNVADGTMKEKFPSRSAIEARDGYVFTSPVGEFKPNAFGLCDMHGNVWERCSDWYGKDYYAKSPADDPRGPPSGLYSVNRGGGWHDGAWNCRSECRDWLTPGFRDGNLGFRVVLVPAE